MHTLPSRVLLTLRSLVLFQAVIEGDRANYESYDYNDYDLYGYDDEDTERMKHERELRNELNQIMSELNMTTTQSPLPNPVSSKLC